MCSKQSKVKANAEVTSAENYCAKSFAFSCFGSWIRIPFYQFWAMSLSRSLLFDVNMPLAYTVFMFPKHFSAIRAQLGLKPLPIEKLPPANVKRREHNTHTAKARVSHIYWRPNESSHGLTVTAKDVTRKHSSRMRTARLPNRTFFGGHHQMSVLVGWTVGPREKGPIQWCPMHHG